MNTDAVRKIAEISYAHAANQGGGSAAASAIVQCIVGAATPLVGNLFSGGTLQERLLFSLVLAGACTTITGDSTDDPDLQAVINVCPETLREAFSIFRHITGVDVKPWLPEPMVRFAAIESRLQ